MTAPSEEWIERVRIAGMFWERGEPLTDEVLPTQSYLLLKFGRTDIMPPKPGWQYKLARGEVSGRPAIV